MYKTFLPDWRVAHGAALGTQSASVLVHSGVGRELGRQDTLGSAWMHRSSQANNCVVNLTETI